MWQVMGIDTSSTEMVVVARTVSKRHIKTTSGSLLHAGEVALTALKHRIKTTSSSLLHAREVEDVATASKCAKNPPRLTFAREGGGESRSPHLAHFASEGDRVGSGTKKRPSQSRLCMRGR